MNSERFLQGSHEKDEKVLIVPVAASLLSDLLPPNEVVTYLLSMWKELELYCRRRECAARGRVFLAR
jgi:hypothetical protein